jgi:hypothetical protein
MPYRRLPNTDVARLNALKSALAKGKELPPFKLAFSQHTYQRVQSFLPYFEKAMIEQRQAYVNQVKRNKEYLNALKKAKLYISHFIQVLNMSIIRGEMSPTVRTMYGLSENDRKVPLLNTEADVIKWGEALIIGEKDRMNHGFSPMTNPTLAVVKVRYEAFLDAYNFQKTLQKTQFRTLSELHKQREEADTIIQAVWNEVEEAFKDLPEDIRREKAKEYGLVYIYRKNELRQINLFESAGISL